ncbi:MAG: hypothetical protein IH857_08305, partial [Deltaproteobacteria bacterium]|nr:hypothetical protein [Deltaproteobacteria bacterium]
RYTGTRGRVAYNTLFSHIGCITPLALSNHHRYMAMIGGRFLFYRVLPLTEIERTEGFNILWEAENRRTKCQTFRELSSGFLHRLLRQTPPIIKWTDGQKEIINNLASLLAHGRAVITTKRGEYKKEQEDKPLVYYEPSEVQIEEPFRAALQLRTLGEGLAWIHGRDYLTEHDLELLRRVVLSTMPMDRAGVLALFQQPEKLTEDGFLTRQLCKEGIGRSYNRANQLLTELCLVGLIQVVKKVEEEKEGPYFYEPLPRFDATIRRPTGPLDHIADLVEGERESLERNLDQESQDMEGTLTQNSP